MPDYIQIGPASATPHERRRAISENSVDASWLRVFDDFAAADAIPSRWLVVEAAGLREADAAEKAAQIDAYKAERQAALRHDVNEYGEGRHYGLSSEMRLKDLYDRAVAGGLTNRAAYIGQVLVWQETLLGDYMTKVAAINAAATVDAVAAVTWDFSTHDATDPLVTVTGALAIAD